MMEKTRNCEIGASFFHKFSFLKYYFLDNDVIFIRGKSIYTT